MNFSNGFKYQSTKVRTQIEEDVAVLVGNRGVSAGKPCSKSSESLLQTKKRKKVGSQSEWLSSSFDSLGERVKAHAKRHRRIVDRCGGEHSDKGSGCFRFQLSYPVGYLANESKAIEGQIQRM